MATDGIRSENGSLAGLDATLRELGKTKDTEELALLLLMLTELYGNSSCR